jgi:hypothetical protein
MPRARAKGTYFNHCLVMRLRPNLYSYIFVDFRNIDDAMFALQAMNGFAFDSKHTFKINQFTDIESFADMDETYYEPEVEEYKPRVRAAPRTLFPAEWSFCLSRNTLKRGSRTLKAVISTSRTVVTS